MITSYFIKSINWLATILLSEDVALAEGLTAFATLIALQYGVAYASVRSQRFAGLVRSEPTLMMRGGTPCHAAMRRARVTEAELMTVIRSSTTPDPQRVAAVVLESDGSFSVIAQPQGGGAANFARAGLRDAPDQS